MNDYLLISDAAKEVEVESHVLRYWEEELDLPIKRNELGHRFYTDEDIERFRQIKYLKERGLQLKAIKMILKDGRLDVIGGNAVIRGGQAPTSEPETKQESRREEEQKAQEPIGMGIEIIETRDQRTISTVPGADLSQMTREEKAKRLQWIIQQMLQETVKQNNTVLCREIKESVMKELDYQFRMQEEREEERDKRLLHQEEEHYRKMDELLRSKSRRKSWLFLDKKGERTGAASNPLQEKESTQENAEMKPEGKKKRHFII